MKKKPSITEETLEKLKAEVLSCCEISYEDIAKDAEVSVRSVNYFFSARHYNPSIHQSAIRLLNRHNNLALDKVVDRQKILSELI